MVLSLAPINTDAECSNHEGITCFFFFLLLHTNATKLQIQFVDERIKWCKINLKKNILNGFVTIRMADCCVIHFLQILMIFGSVILIKYNVRDSQ